MLLKHPQALPQLRKGRRIAFAKQINFNITTMSPTRGMVVTHAQFYQHDDSTIKYNVDKMSFYRISESSKIRGHP